MTFLTLISVPLIIVDSHGKNSLHSDSDFDKYDGIDMMNRIHHSTGTHKFQNNKPFPHIKLTDFLIPSVAEELYNDFPEFETGNYLNEFGKPGGKSTQPDIKKISPNYKKFHSYIGSPVFLNHMSDITGIPNLLNDPYMFGAGTHENRHGQSLNIHVDFNYNHPETWHRRVNLLLYLNKEWYADWGGLIEFHSNPWGKNDTKVVYGINFNQAVIFVTTENSWHGFERINITQDKRKSHSRKLISIYLYTRDRPENEIVGPHGTYYVPWKLNPTCMFNKIDAYQQYSTNYLQDYMLKEKTLSLDLKRSKIETYNYIIQKQFTIDSKCGNIIPYPLHGIHADSVLEKYIFFQVQNYNYNIRTLLIKFKSITMSQKVSKIRIVIHKEENHEFYKIHDISHEFESNINVELMHLPQSQSKILHFKIMSEQNIFEPLTNTDMRNILGRGEIEILC